MSIDPKAVGLMLAAVRAPVLAITTRDGGPGEGGRDNGMIGLGAGPGSILPEAMRIMIAVQKPNLTHDMILGSGVFAVHLLPAGPEAELAAALEIVKELGGHSGREHDKLARFAVTRGETGAPLLQDALLYVECRLARSFDGDENTFFLGDIVAARRLRKGAPLDAADLWRALPPDWTAAYERSHEDGLMVAARRARGLG